MSDTKIDDGGPAFPCDVQVEDNSGSHYEERYGLTMRDWFAGQVLVGILSGDQRFFSPSELATISYWAADAMLAARNKKE